MTEFLETQVDKIFFKVATDRVYSNDGIWLKKDGEIIQIGLSDYVQQRSGDIAFVEIKPNGSQVKPGEEIASLETIKVDADVASPVTAQIIRPNPKMEKEPECINSDPYGDGWLCEIKATHWESDLQNLLSAEDYFLKMKQEAEEDAKLL